MEGEGLSMAWRLSREPLTLWDVQERTRQAYRRERRCLYLGTNGLCGRPAVTREGDDLRCADHGGAADPAPARRSARQSAASPGRSANATWRVTGSTVAR